MLAAISERLGGAPGRLHTDCLTIWKDDTFRNACLRHTPDLYPSETGRIALSSNAYHWTGR